MAVASARSGLWTVGIIKSLVETHRDGEILSETVAHPYSLHNQFDRVVFFPDPDEGQAGPLDYVSKWASGIDSCVSMPAHLEFGERLADELSRLTGIPISVRAPCVPEGAFRLFIAIAERAKLEALLAEWGWPGVLDQAECLALPAGEGGAISYAYIAIPHRSSMVEHCIVHEVMHSLGLPGHAEIAGPSTMGLRSQPLTELSLNDKIIVRTLYDPRITPGMPREEALEVARVVIAELVNAVRQGGVEALYQRQLDAPQPGAPMQTEDGPG